MRRKDWWYCGQIIETLSWEMLARNATETALGLNAVFDIFEECEGRIGGTVDKS